MARLREVNVAIERAAKLRAGSCRTKLVSAARAAVKANSAPQLIAVLEGDAGGQPAMR